MLLQTTLIGGTIGRVETQKFTLKASEQGEKKFWNAGLNVLEEVETGWFSNICSSRMPDEKICLWERVGFTAVCSLSLFFPFLKVGRVG